MTKQEKNVVMAVFSTLLEKSYSELNTFMGSITIQEMKNLYNCLKYEDYCQRHNVSYEDMTEDDFMQAYEEEHPENDDYDYDCEYDPEYDYLYN